jgi:GT2 family glycosyltransferase
LFEPRPGKNCALNHALDTVRQLGEIVVFTDDDVVPHTDWLKVILAACERWSEYDVFGGKIDLIWPDGMEIPRWATENVTIRGVGFGEHDLGTEVKPYQHGSKPSGPNYWVRRTVFSEGARFNESIGPRPGQQFAMGDETEFLLRLAAGDARMMYVPGATVGHHVQVSLLDPGNMLRRAIRLGRGKPHSGGIPDPEKLVKSPWRWRMRRIIAMAWYVVKFLRARLHRDECLRMKNAVEALCDYAYHREALSMSWGSS